MSRETVIPLHLVRLALHSRKIAACQRRSNPKAGNRWAAMAAHMVTNECVPAPGRRFSYWVKPLLTPMFSGYMASLVERVRDREGLQGVLRTWGVGYRAMQAETRSGVMR